MCVLVLDVNADDLAVLDRDIPGPSGDEVGADDNLTEPFELRELVLRLRARDHRRGHSRPPVREVAGLRVDPFRSGARCPGSCVAGRISRVSV